MIQDLCVRVVSQNFEEKPHFGRLPEKYISKIIEGLDIDLPLELVGTVSATCVAHIGFYSVPILHNSIFVPGEGQVLKTMVTWLTYHDTFNLTYRVRRRYSRRALLEKAVLCTLEELPGRLRFLTHMLLWGHLCQFDIIASFLSLVASEVTAHGMSWKQLYFERNVENAMERYV
eukprot:2401904-Pyramimonas_sp.AAC.1